MDELKDLIERYQFAKIEAENFKNQCEQIAIEIIRHNVRINRKYMNLVEVIETDDSIIYKILDFHEIRKLLSEQFNDTYFVNYIELIIADAKNFIDRKRDIIITKK